jgi:hypothetical protein
MLQVTIYHGVKAHNFDGYEPGDPVAPVFVYVATVPIPTQAAALAAEAERAFRLFNADLDMLGGQDRVTAAQYRALKLRSLSVGDLVAVGATVYACRSLGFERVPTALNVQPSPWLDEIWADDLGVRTGLSPLPERDDV